MAAAKEIRTKIKSIANTQKITRAMEMVAASKMRRALERRNAARPYALKMRQVTAHIAQAHSEYRHPFMAEREPKRVGVLLVSTDRGLCGGLNINLFRALLREMEGLERVRPRDRCLRHREQGRDVHAPHRDERRRPVHPSR